MTGPGGQPARLRLVTWNVRICRRREGERVDLDLTVETLRSLDADVVALQELDRDQERSDRADQARSLGEALGMRWFYAPALLGQAENPDSWRPAGAAGDDLRVRRAWIAAGPVSDHRAAVVDIELAGIRPRSPTPDAGSAHS